MSSYPNRGLLLADEDCLGKTIEELNKTPISKVYIAIAVVIIIVLLVAVIVK